VLFRAAWSQPESIARIVPRDWRNLARLPAMTSPSSFDLDATRSEPTAVGSSRRAYDLPAWILAAGLGLATIGFAIEPPQNPVTPTLTTPSFATSDSNDRMIAVTGIDVTGTSVLYVIDTIERRLSVYQADGGGKSTAGVQWVGARNIDLDFAVDGWNDKSEVTFKELRKKLDARGVLPDSSR